MGNSEQQRIGAFELIDHGIEHSQYFQGCGVAFSSYRHAVTGIGNNPAEAIEDCLEQMAQAGFDTEGMEARIREQEGLEALPTVRRVVDECGEDCEEVYYHVSIRWNPAGEVSVHRVVRQHGGRV